LPIKFDDSYYSKLLMPISAQNFAQGNIRVLRTIALVCGPLEPMVPLGDGEFLENANLSTKLTCNVNHYRQLQKVLSGREGGEEGEGGRDGSDPLYYSHQLADQHNSYSQPLSCDRSVDIGCVGLARLLRLSKHLLGCCIYMCT
jgi:hypothetical protein